MGGWPYHGARDGDAQRYLCGRTRAMPWATDCKSGDRRHAGPAFQVVGKDLPDLVLRLCTQPSPPTTLNNETWTKPSRVWASVTPVVLDKFPKQSMTQNHNLWQAEVCQIIALSCERAGLPVPIHVGINTTAWHRGISLATAKTRRFGSGQKATSPLGDGFPTLSSRKDLPPKPQIHVCLEFAEPVAGPVLIGSGRFVGYGLCLPK